VPKLRQRYVCSSCGWQTIAYVGRCSQCQAWNSLTEIAEARPARSQSPSAAAEAVALGEVPTDGEVRLVTGIGEFDQVLGGGLVAASVVLIGGEPGVGKSTLVLQAADALARRGARVGSLCGEESPRQVRMRAERLGLADSPVRLLTSPQLGPVLARAEAEGFDVLVIDSVQTVVVEGVESRTGGPAQLTEIAAAAVAWAKATGTAVILTGHVTKGGDLAGPRLLEHLVDVVLYFEGADSGLVRVLRAVKNRFGATDEIGVFEMTGGGLRSVEQPAHLFLAGRDLEASGSVLTAVMEGTRPIVVEVQALAVPSHLAVPRRTAVGIEAPRLHLLLAVLARRAGVNAGTYDVVVSASGGLRIRDSAADLALALALVSAVRDEPLPGDLAAVGEVALSGAIRPVVQLGRRLAELERLGVRRCIVPAGADLPAVPLELTPAATLRQAVRQLFGATPAGRSGGAG